MGTPLRIAVVHARVSDDRERQALLDLLTDWNTYLVRRYELPRLRDARIAYRAERRADGTPWGEERWLDARAVLAQGSGDCDDLAPYLAAERRVYDSDATARAIYQRRTPESSHCVVRSRFGLEDPSRTCAETVGIIR